MKDIKVEIYKNVPTDAGNRDYEVTYTDNDVIIKDITFNFINTSPELKNELFIDNCENEKSNEL